MNYAANQEHHHTGTLHSGARMTDPDHGGTPRKLTALEEIGIHNTVHPTNKRWVGTVSTETNTEHILEMFYITDLYFKKYPKLNKILDFEEIIKKIAIHDL